MVPCVEGSVCLHPIFHPCIVVDSLQPLCPALGSSLHFSCPLPTCHHFIGFVHLERISCCFCPLRLFRHHLLNEVFTVPHGCVGLPCHVSSSTMNRPQKDSSQSVGLVRRHGTCHCTCSFLGDKGGFFSCFEHIPGVSQAVIMKE